MPSLNYTSSSDSCQRKGIYCSQIIEETPHITQGHHITGEQQVEALADEVRGKQSYGFHGEERVREMRGRESNSMGAGLTSVP